MQQPLATTDQRVSQWNRSYGVAGVTFRVDQARAGVIVAELRNSHGGVATISTAGAHLLSARLASKSEDLFYMSSLTKYPPHGAIRGGNPIVLGWFGGREGFPSHGFGRLAQWKPTASKTEGDTVSLRLELDRSGLREHPLFANDPVWGQAQFTASVEFILSPRSVEQRVSFVNNGGTSLALQCGFHPYFKVSNYRSVSMKGLEALPSLNALEGKRREPALEAPLTFQGAMDRIHLPAEGGSTPVEAEIIDAQAGRVIRITQMGLPNWVVWNPGDNFAAKSSWKEDTDTNQGFVCVEPMMAVDTATVAPGASLQFGIAFFERAAGR